MRPLICTLRTLEVASAPESVQTSEHLVPTRADDNWRKPVLGEQCSSVGCWAEEPVYVCGRTSMWKLEVDIGFLLQLLFTFRQVSSKPELTDSSTVASQLAPWIYCVYSPSTGISSMCHHTGLSMSSREPNKSSFFSSQH